LPANVGASPDTGLADSADERLVDSFLPPLLGYRLVCRTSSGAELPGAESGSVSGNRNKFAGLAVGVPVVAGTVGCGAVAAAICSMMSANAPSGAFAELASDCAMFPDAVLAAEFAEASLRTAEPATLRTVATAPDVTKVATSEVA
jgi:hypothetical protein